MRIFGETNLQAKQPPLKVPCMHVMSETWKEHCPIDEDEHPVQRQAWHGGWMHRVETGPGTPGGEVGRRMIAKPSMLSTWLEGYSAADNYLRRDKLYD